MKIYVAGHKGLVGSAIVRKIEKSNIHTWVGKERNSLDLLNRKDVFDYIAGEKPDAIILAAAKVGGINANSQFPVEFLSENLQIQSNVIDGAHAARTEQFLFLGSSCIYPKFAHQPIKESELLTGSLEETNEPYAIAKIAGLKLINAYRNEYGHKWISAMPTNVYGPNDNFDTKSSHVLPALIRKFHDAKIHNLSSVVLWGTGTPLREFIHVDDLADALLFLLENFDASLPINIGTGQEISIKNLASLVSDIVGYAGQITWDDSMPDGTPRKALDNSELRELGWEPSISLEDGVSKTYEWFVNNFKN
jgi:GDP-L-fucose synthase